MPGEDVFSISDGFFTSSGCRRYGFSAAPHWLRVEGDAVPFRAGRASPEAGVSL